MAGGGDETPARAGSGRGELSCVLDRAQDRGFLGIARQDDHGDETQVGMRSERPEGLDSVPIGHLHVDNRDIGKMLAGFGKRLDSIVRDGDQVVLAEHPGQQLTEHGVVVNNKQSGS